MSYKPVLSFKVASTLAANLIVGMGPTAETVVAPTAVSGTPFVGVTDDTVLDITSGIPVQVGGIHKVYFNDTVAAQGLVTADSSGYGVPYTAVTAGTWFIGALVGPAVTATGTIADVLIMPGISSSEA